MPLETKLVGHYLVAVPEFAVGHVVAAGLGQQGPQSEQREIPVGPLRALQNTGQPFDRGLGLRQVVVCPACQ